MTDSWRLDILPCEILLTIFDYCDVIDLIRITQVCKRFYGIIHTDNAAWVKRSEQSLVTNQISEKFRKRCNPLLSARDKYLTSYNWKYGKYSKNVIFSKRKLLMPWLQMTDEVLWWCDGYYLYGTKRKDQFKKKSKKRNFFSNEKYTAADFSKFVLWKNFIISGHSNGSIKYWMNTPYKDGFRTRILRTVQNAHLSYINTIDVTSRNIISGSDDGTIKIQNSINTPDDCHNEFGVNTSIMGRVQSLAIDPTEMKCAVGSCGLTLNIPPLHMLDIEYCKFTHTIEHQWRYGAGILDMVWDNPHILLTCGYDSNIRKWDMRIGKCVNTWPDPNDATIYCISTDYQYSMISGTQYNSMAVLFDQRQNNFVQIYYVNPKSASPSSPIYSLKFDSSHLYCITDRYLVELNFSDYLCQKNDYKKLYVLYEKSRLYR